MQRLKILSNALFLAFFFLYLSGCSAQSKDKLLRTLFDGVPAPKQKIAAVKEEKQEIKEVKGEKAIAESTAFFHAPFLQGECESCHESKFSQKLIVKGKELCFSCHDDFTKGKKVIHYPVSEGECSECHDPHQSVNKYMLKNTVPKLCFTCHDEKDVRQNPVHEGLDNCAECHNPHASNEEKLLK